MKKNILKKVICLALVLCFMAIPVFSFADDATDKSYWDSLTSGGNAGGLDEVATSVGGGIVGVIRTIGYVVAIGMLIWLGVKWMMASAQEKADLKNKAWGYVIGAVLVFGASTLLPIIANFAQSIGE